MLRLGALLDKPYIQIIHGGCPSGVGRIIVIMVILTLIINPKQAEYQALGKDLKSRFNELRAMLEVIGML